MARRKVVAGNWKMNMDLASGENFVKSLVSDLRGTEKTDVIFCPPFPLLVTLSEVLAETSFGLGAQNLFWEEKGAYTGEVSADMLVSVGCKYVIIGHSERRKYFEETDEMVNRKLKGALRSGLIPIMCIGETLDERQTNQTEQVVKTQMQDGLQDLGREELNKMIIAYEPVWAIGTGKNATPEQAVEVHQFIRHTLRQWFDDQLAQETRIQYGGSVNENNALEILSQTDIDGALVGGASLKADSFTEIVRAAEHSS
jgi:triosephosphate isomerase